MVMPVAARIAPVKAWSRGRFLVMAHWMKTMMTGEVALIEAMMPALTPCERARLSRVTPPMTPMMAVAAMPLRLVFESGFWAWKGVAMSGMRGMGVKAMAAVVILMVAASMGLNWFMARLWMVTTAMACAAAAASPLRMARLSFPSVSSYWCVSFFQLPFGPP